MGSHIAAGASMLPSVVRHHVFVLALFGALTLVFAYPLSVHPGSQALDLGPDTRLFLWTLAWDVHALWSQPLAIFDANIFHPELRTLAYSEHQIGSALFAAPVLASTGELLLAMNWVLLLSCVLSGIGAFYLARELGAGFWGALMAGALFAFTPPRFFRLGQLHLATVQWMPFCLLAVHRYAKGGSTRALLAASFLFTLQAWTGGQSALFLALAIAALAFYLVALGEMRPSTRLVPDALMGAAVVAALNLPFVLPYFEVRETLGLERSLAEALAWSPNAESFLASPAHVHRFVLERLGWQATIAENAKAYLFPGLFALVLPLLTLRPTRAEGARNAKASSPWLDLAIILVFLMAVALEVSGGVRFQSFSASGGGRAAALGIGLVVLRLLVYGRRPFARGFRARYVAWANRRIGVHACFYGWLALFTTWASLGPPGGLYTVLYEIVPGFDFIRVPSRLTLLTVLALSVLAGLGVERLRRSWRPVLLVLALADLAAFPLPSVAYAIPESPMDGWLAELPEAERGPVVVLPVPDPRDDVAAARHHSSYMLFSIEHFLPLVNGYSGFTPPEHDRLFRELGTFPDRGTLDALTRFGVRYAVLHRASYGESAWARTVERAFEHPSRLELRAEFPEGAVFELLEPEREN